MTQQAQPRFDGRKLLNAILDKAENSSIRLVKVILVPNSVLVKMPEAEYQRISSARVPIEQEMKQGLEDWLAEKNRTSVLDWLRLHREAILPWTLQAGVSFTVSLQPDLDGTVAPGQADIDMDMAVQPDQAESGALVPDHDVTEVIGAIDDQTLPVDVAIRGVARAPKADLALSASRVIVMANGARSEKLIRKPQFKVGRGGNTEYVDIRVEDAHVSRVHLIVRRNGQGFEARDVSAYGSSVAGDPLPKKEWRAVNGPIELAPGVTIQIEDAA
jgi:hypothetical protein